MWQEAFMAHIMVLSWHLPGRSEENNEEYYLNHEPTKQECCPLLCNIQLLVCCPVMSIKAMLTAIIFIFTILLAAYFPTLHQHLWQYNLFTLFSIIFSQFWRKASSFWWESFRTTGQWRAFCCHHNYGSKGKFWAAKGCFWVGIFEKHWSIVLFLLHIHTTIFATMVVV